MRVFGSSLGALLGLVLVSRHPSAARLLVAHEPPATELLPAAERDQAVKAQIEVEEVHRSEGITAAMRQFGAVAGVDFADREPEVEIPQPKPERIANLEFFLTHDAPRGAALPPQPSGAARRRGPDPPRRGAELDHLPRDCAQALATALQRPLAEFPGGHSGFVLHPRSFAARLRALLTTNTQTER